MTAPFILHQGDCLNRETGLWTLPDRSVDVWIADPPYDADTHGKSRRGLTNYKERPQKDAAANRVRDLGFKPLTDAEMYGAAFQAARVVRRWTMNFCSLEMIAKWKHAYEAAGLEYVRAMIWRKRGSTPQLTGDRPAQACEAIVLAHPPGRKRWNGGGLHGVFDLPIVINRSGKKPRYHATQKPLRLLCRLVELFTNEGDLILDPFAGSGTTGVAALKLGRRFIGWEKDRAVFRVAQDRLTRAKAKYVGAPRTEVA